MEKVAIIAVNYKNYLVTEDFLRCFEKQSASSFRIFISDLSDEREEISRRDFLQIKGGKNKGYAHGVNIGLQEAVRQGFRKFAVINNDTYIQENFIALVLKSLQKNKNTLIGGKIYYYPGFEYHKGQYKKADEGRVIWYAGGLIDWDNMIISHRGVDKIDKGQYDAITQTEFITGCFMAFDKNVLDIIGYWDESYFLYYEDTDWCERAKRRGIKLLFDPSIVIWHKNAQSTGGAGSDLHRRYQEKNRLRFAFKYAPLRTNLHLIKNLFSDIFNLLGKRK